MKWKILVVVWIGMAVLFYLGAGALYLHLRSADSSPQNDKVAALKELRDTGVISAQEYDTRIRAVQSDAPAQSSTPPSATSLASLTKAAFAGTRKVEVSDSAYQATAYTLEIPADWKFAGDIVRPPGCHATGASLKYTAQSPDGLTAAVLLPGVTWSWSNSESLQKIAEQSHCPGIDIDTAASFLVNIAIPNIRPKAKVTAMLPLLPEGQASLKAQLEKQREQNAAMARQYGQSPQKLTLDGARARVQYDRDGHSVEEMISTVIQCTESTMPALYNQPAYQRRSCTSRGTTIERAPQGHLDEVVASAQYKSLIKSLQANPEWQKRLMADQQAAFQKSMAANNAQFQSFMKNNEAQHEAMLARGREFDANLKASTDRAMAADRQKQAAIDASAHATALYSLDRQEFRNPDTGQVIEASNQYNHQWLSSDGSTLIQTNDHGFDPNGVVYPVSQSWSELVVK